MERVEIYSVAISSNLKWVAVSSEKGTLHVFHLRPDILSLPKTISQVSSLSFIRGKLKKSDDNCKSARLKYIIIYAFLT